MSETATEPGGDEQVDQVDPEFDAVHELAREHQWPPWAAAFLLALRKVPDETGAARAAGVARSTPWRLKDRDEEFAQAVVESRDMALDRLESAIYLRGIRGVPLKKTVTRTFADGSKETTVTEDLHVSDNLAMFFLKRWRIEYREAYNVTHGGTGGGPIRMEVDRVPTRERMLELLRIASELELPERVAIEGTAERIENGGSANGDSV